MDDIFGTVDNPLADTYGDVGTAGGGLVGLLSNIVTLITIIAGIYSFLNFVFAGLMYINAGDKPEETAKAWQRIYMSMIGLAVIVGSYAIAAIVGLVLFGSASAILSPVITGPGA